MSRTPRNSSPVRGFSLIEVTIAMGVMAVGMLSVMGLLGPALGMLHESGQRTTSTRIAEQLIGDAQLADWSAIEAAGDDVNRRVLFDEEGVEVDEDDELLSYVAYVQVSSFPDVLLPGVEIGNSSRDLRRVVVRVAHDPTGAATWTAAPERFTTYSSIVAITE